MYQVVFSRSAPLFTKLVVCMYCFPRRSRSMQNGLHVCSVFPVGPALRKTGRMYVVCSRSVPLYTARLYTKSVRQRGTPNLGKA